MRPAGEGRDVLGTEVEDQQTTATRDGVDELGNKYIATRIDPMEIIDQGDGQLLLFVMRPPPRPNSIQCAMRN